MKKILVLFLIIAGIYIGFMNLHKITWLPWGNQSNQASINHHTDKLIIDINGVNTAIIPENRDNVKADLKGKGNVTIRKSGDRISVKYTRKWLNWMSFFDHSKLTIYIPKDYDQNVDINMGSGNLNYDGLNTKLNDLTVDMGSGNFHLKNLTVNHFEHDGSSGNMVFDKLKTKSGSFDISSGNVHLNHYSGKLTADVSSGNFKVQMDRLENDVDVEVSSGNIQLNLPNNASFKLNGKISGGIISNDFSLKNQQESRQYIKGTHGSGKHHVDLHVSSGRIKVY